MHKFLADVEGGMDVVGTVIVGIFALPLLLPLWLIGFVARRLR